MAKQIANLLPFGQGLSCKIRTNAYATQLAPPPVSRWRRWALLGWALLGWQAVSSCATQPPLAPPTATTAAALTPAAGQNQPVVIRGLVLDGDKGPSVAGAFLFINDTQYGTTTDENGRFELVLAPGWAPVRVGLLTLHVQAGHFLFKPQEIPVKVAGSGPPIELLIKMESIEGRGQIRGKAVLPKPPLAPPKR